MSNNTSFKDVVFLEQYPLDEVLARCNEYMLSVDFDSVEDEIISGRVTYINVSDSISLFPHLRLDEDCQLYCYLAYDCHGRWGQVVALDKDYPVTSFELSEDGFFYGPESQLPYSGPKPDDRIHMDGTPEGYLEAVIAQEFFVGLPYVRSEKWWDICLVKPPEDFAEWNHYVDVPDWTPRVWRDNRSKEASVWACWHTYSSQLNMIDGCARIYMREHVFSGYRSMNTAHSVLLATEKKGREEGRALIEEYEEIGKRFMQYLKDNNMLPKPCPAPKIK